MENSKTLLIVDDEPVLRRILVDLFDEEGWTLLQAESGKEALEVLASTKANVILSDISMPNMSGIELLKTIRAKEQVTPVIFLTAFADKNNAVEALRLGAFDFLEKPFDSGKLLSIVRQAFVYAAELDAIDVAAEKLAEKASSEKVKQYKKVKQGVALLQLAKTKETKKKSA